jgi:hypothetical protein
VLLVARSFLGSQWAMLQQLTQHCQLRRRWQTMRRVTHDRNSTNDDPQLVDDVW